MRIRVAIVDDDSAALAALGGLVDALGYLPLCFADPADFLASHEARNVDVLIADLRLRDFSGIVLHRRLRDEGRDLPTILVTAHPDEATRRRALRAGFHGYLAKPVAPEELLECLRRAAEAAG